LVHKTQDEDEQSKRHNILCVVHHYAQANINNVNKTPKNNWRYRSRRTEHRFYAEIVADIT
jgi:hypothetical protein